jgi:cation:H+ antiporter
VILDLLQLAAGAAMLYFGAEWLVKGAAGLALALRIPPVVVGATVVAYATSAPELTVSVAAALEGKSAITLGNVIGSNVANLGLILGLTALIAPPLVGPGLIRRELPVLLATTLLPVVLLRDGRITRVEGAVMLLGSVAFSLWMLRAQSQAPGTTSELPADDGKHSRGALAAIGLVGLALLVGGGKVFVDGAVAIARAAGMSERVVGLTIVAAGTSLPELAASVVAALRGHSDIAVGNVVGSNIFNVLLILGATAVVHPVEGSLRDMGADLVALFALTIMAIIALRTGRKIQRWEGAVLLGGYVAFLVFVLGT